MLLLGCSTAKPSPALALGQQKDPEHTGTSTICHASLELSNPPATHLAPGTTLPVPKLPLKFHKGQKPQRLSDAPCPGHRQALSPHGCEDKGNLLDAQKKLNLEREFVSN